MKILLDIATNKVTIKCLMILCDKLNYGRLIPDDHLYL